MSSEYITQSICNRWASHYSNWVNVGNEVRQDRTIFPLLFNVDMNELYCRLRLSMRFLGCRLGDQVINLMLYADAIARFLQKDCKHFLNPYKPCVPDEGHHLVNYAIFPWHLVTMIIFLEIQPHELALFFHCLSSTVYTWLNMVTVKKCSAYMG